MRTLFSNLTKMDDLDENNFLRCFSTGSARCAPVLNTKNVIRHEKQLRLSPHVEECNVPRTVRF